MKRLSLLFVILAMVVGFVVFPPRPALSDVPVNTVSGTLSAANQAVLVNPLVGQGTCRVTVTGTWVGTIAFLGTNIISGTPNIAIPLGTDNAPSTTQTSTTANGSFVGSCLALTQFEAQMAAFTSGSAVVTVTAQAGGGFSSGGGGGGGGSVTQGTTPWLVGGQGTAGNPAAGVVTIQGVTAGQPVPINGQVTIGNNINIASPLPLPVGCITGCAAPINGGATAQPTGSPGAIAMAVGNGATLDSLGGSVIPGGTPPPNLSILTVQNPPATPAATALPTHSAGAGAADALCAGACTVYSVVISNSTASTVFCPLYNIAAASVTPGTSVWTVAPIIVPPTSTLPTFIGPTNGARFPTAAAISCTTTWNGATPVGAGLIGVTWYKL